MNSSVRLDQKHDFTIRLILHSTDTFALILFTFSGTSVIKHLTTLHRVAYSSCMNITNTAARNEPMNVFRKPQENERNPHASLYFGNLDNQVAEPLLYELFIQVGPIKQLNLPKDRVLGAHQGYGFVEFKTIEDAEYALSILRGVRLFGRTLKINKIEAHMPLKANVLYHTPSMSVGARLFVGNLHKLTDAKYLKDTFGAFGNILREPEVIRDGKRKCHAFIEFADFESSDLAIEKLNDATLSNNKVRVSYAYKEGLAGRKFHGDEADRLLAKQAKVNLSKKKKSGKI